MENKNFQLRKMRGHLFNLNKPTHRTKKRKCTPMVMIQHCIPALLSYPLHLLLLNLCPVSLQLPLKTHILTISHCGGHNLV